MWLQLMAWNTATTDVLECQFPRRPETPKGLLHFSPKSVQKKGGGGAHSRSEMTPFRKSSAEGEGWAPPSLKLA